MFGFEGPDRRKEEERVRSEGRLPPGQSLTLKFPVLQLIIQMMQYVTQLLRERAEYTFGRLQTAELTGPILPEIFLILQPIRLCLELQLRG